MIPTMLVSFALGDSNFSRHPTQNPNASRWKIGCVGLQTQNSCVGHVHFILFVSISFALGGQPKHSFSVEYGLKGRAKSVSLGVCRGLKMGNLA